MNSTERVKNTILGKEIDLQPIYGWVYENMREEINRVYGSVETFEDHYEFDAAHIFGGPGSIKKDLIQKIADENDELTPDLLVDQDIFTSPDNIESYHKVICIDEINKGTVCAGGKRFCADVEPNGIYGLQNGALVRTGGAEYYKPGDRPE